MTGKAGRSGNYARGPRPNTWKTGLDPLLHDMFGKWHKHRAQAHFRGEIHELSFEDWCEIWHDPADWFNRGKQSQNVCLYMNDPKQGWVVGNVEIITRKEQLRRQGFLKRGTKYRTKD